jgi:hypothetical protein
VLEWGRWWRRALVALGVLMLLRGGVSLFGQPAREILYHADPPLVVCSPRLCTVIYRLEVGNTGSAAQDMVTVRLRRSVVGRAILPVRGRDYGKVERPLQVRDEGEVRAYGLGRLDTRVRVELSFVLNGPGPETAVPWDRVLVGVEAPGAPVRVADAGWVMVLRAWLAFLGLF